MGKLVPLQDARLTPAKSSVTRPGLQHLGITSGALLLRSCAVALITRTLGPAAFGSYAFCLWLATVAVPVIGVAMSTPTNRQIVDLQSHEPVRATAGIFYFLWRRQYRRIGFYCLIYLLLAIPFALCFGQNVPVLLFLLAGLSAPPLLLSAIAGTTLRALHRFDLLVGIQFLEALAMVLAVLVATQLPPGQNTDALFIAARLLLAMAGASIFTLLIALICLSRLLPLRNVLYPGPSLQGRLRHMFKHSLPLYTLDLLVWRHSELLFLAYWRGATELGWYASGLLISTGVMQFPPTLLSNCLLPLFLRYIPGQHYTNPLQAFIRTTLYLSLLTLPLCTLLIFFCPAIILTLFGYAYLPLVPVLRLLLIAAAAGSISTIALTYLAHDEHKRVHMRLNTGAALLNTTLAIPCIASWGMTGAALACMSGQLLSSGIALIFCLRQLLRGEYLHYAF